MRTSSPSAAEADVEVDMALMFDSVRATPPEPGKPLPRAAGASSAAGPAVSGSGACRSAPPDASELVGLAGAPGSAADAGLGSSPGMPYAQSPMLRSGAACWARVQRGAAAVANTDVAAATSRSPCASSAPEYQDRKKRPYDVSQLPPQPRKNGVSCSALGSSFSLTGSKQYTPYRALHATPTDPLQIAILHCMTDAAL